MNTYFKIGSNQRERNTQAICHVAGEDVLSRVDFLYSYDTPVAFYCHRSGTVYTTSQKFSTTTTRHLNKWLQRFAGYEIKPVPQATIDQIHHRANLWEAQQAGVL